MRAKSLESNNVFFTTVFFLAAFFLIMPGGIADILPQVVPLYRVMQAAFFIAAVFLMMITWRRNSIGLWLILIYFAVSYGMSYFVHGNQPKLGEPIIVVSLSVISSFGWRNKRKNFLDGFVLCFEVFAYLQILLQILYPSGMFVSEGFHQNWLLGYKNTPVRYLLPGACFMILRYENGGNKNRFHVMRMCVYFAAFLGVVLASLSATGIIGMAAFFILMFVYWKRPFPRLINIRNAAIAAMIVFLLVYFADLQYKFEFLIVGIFGKSMNFTGRIRVWTKTFKLIGEHWLMGVGVFESTKRVLGPYNHAHQYWLQILLTSGVIGTALHFSIFDQASRKLEALKEDRGARAIVITVIAFMVMGIDEALTRSYMLLPLLAIACDYRKRAVAFMRIKRER